MKSPVFALALLLITLVGCSTNYVTPGAAVNINDITDKEISDILSIKPAATFPTNLATVRVQASGYSNHQTTSYGQGRYSVVTVREVEADSDYDQLKSLPQVRGVAPINKILLPQDLDTIKTLREASAKLKSDILMVYTFDTYFHANGQKFIPLNVIALGFLNNKEVSVTTTVSAAFFDVRTEYLYGIAEATSSKSKFTSVWGESGVVDDLRLETEKTAFKNLIPEIKNTWNGIIQEYANPTQ
ncbi:hypothetical protein MAH1_04000 [Sessilibacter sp. MAH1]